ncbi:hypothetical protein ACE10Z_13900 [Bradyrhizobium sp. Pha-3]|uniref:hypothetical protein n=1 Tax=Bradyrhizobium sp. Pha-3 TaxID=208375 RepID=UPI0035D4FDC2
MQDYDAVDKNFRVHLDGDDQRDLVAGPGSLTVEQAVEKLRNPPSNKLADEHSRSMDCDVLTRRQDLGDLPKVHSPNGLLRPTFR